MALSENFPALKKLSRVAAAATFTLAGGIACGPDYGESDDADAGVADVSTQTDGGGTPGADGGMMSGTEQCSAATAAKTRWITTRQQCEACLDTGDGHFIWTPVTPQPIGGRTVEEQCKVGG